MLKEVNSWLNKNKTEIIVFSQSGLLDGYGSVIGPLSVYCKHFVWNLVVIKTSYLFFSFTALK